MSTPKSLRLCPEFCGSNCLGNEFRSCFFFGVFTSNGGGYFILFSMLALFMGGGGCNPRGLIRIWCTTIRKGPKLANDLLSNKLELLPPRQEPPSLTSVLLGWKRSIGATAGKQWLVLCPGKAPGLCHTCEHHLVKGNLGSYSWRKLAFCHLFANNASSSFFFP